MIVESTKFYTNRWFRAYKVVGRIALVLGLSGASWHVCGQSLDQPERKWVPLINDHVHDPRGPAIKQLQQPGEILSQLPAHTSGNQVRWAVALDRGAINPRRSRTPSKTQVPVLDMDVLMDLNGSMNIVRFPHRIHTQWLACDNCHEHLFKSKAGTNNLSMFQILLGEQCGLCHGAVAFPLTECQFCHSVERRNSDFVSPMPHLGPRLEK